MLYPNEQIQNCNLHHWEVAHKLWQAVWLSHATAVVQVCPNEGLNLGGSNGAGEKKADPRDSKERKVTTDHRNGILTDYQMLGR